MTYAAQLEFKQKSVLDALKRIAHIPEPPIQNIIGCENPTFYRNKMEYTFTDRRWLDEKDFAENEIQDRNGLGLHVAGAFMHVTDVQKCHLQPEPANAIRNFVRDFSKEQGFNFQNVKYHTGFLRNLVLRNNTAGQFMVTVVFGEDDAEKRELLLNALLREFDYISSLHYTINTKPNDSTFDLEFIHVSGDPYLLMNLGHIEYMLGPKSFFQTNSNQAQVMCRVVKEMAGLTGHELVYDLYSGIGSFALYLAKEAKHIIGIEEIAEAVEDARVNALHNQINNVQFFAGDVRRIIHQSDIREHGAPSVIVTDPPRAGMDPSVVESLIQLNAPTIVYVSCNPATQARDIEMMSGHYQLVQSQPIDMFPQTAHVENVALLQRVKP
jgi:23S rRNA (uracil1939-C5)-methyltransferase